MVHENVKWDISAFIFQRIFVIWQIFLLTGRRRVVALSQRTYQEPHHFPPRHRGFVRQFPPRGLSVELPNLRDNGCHLI